MRLTIKKLEKLINEMFIRYELNMLVSEIVKTRFRGQDYESGACTYWVKTKTPEFDGVTFLIFSPLREIESYINAGYIPSLRIENHGYFDDEIFFHKVKSNA